LRKNWKKKDG